MRLAVIVPYRDRAEHLTQFVPCMTRQLGEEGIAFDIVVVEQAGSAPFNRGKIRNAGFLLTEHLDWHCFHDVDLLPVRNSDYSPPNTPTQLYSTTLQSDEVPFDNDNLGGVALFLPAHFRRVNGYSNRFWGWGCEDNDLSWRCVTKGMTIAKRPVVYDALPHPSHLDEHDYERNVEYLMRGVDCETDGLSTLDFEVLERRERDGYQHILVDVGPPERD